MHEAAKRETGGSEGDPVAAERVHFTRFGKEFDGNPVRWQVKGRSVVEVGSPEPEPGFRGVLAGET